MRPLPAQQIEEHQSPAHMKQFRSLHSVPSSSPLARSATSASLIRSCELHHPLTPVATRTKVATWYHTAPVMHGALFKPALCQTSVPDQGAWQGHLERVPACRSYTALPRDCFCWCPFCRPFCMGAVYVKYGAEEGSLSGRPTIGGALLEGLERVCWKPLRSGGRLCERSNTSCPTSASAQAATAPEQCLGRDLHALRTERLPMKACQS